jgi:outer membrane receptor for ferrienterochelin and colicins
MRVQQQTLSIGNYAQLQWQPIEALTLLAGTRYDISQVRRRDSLRFSRGIWNPRANVLWQPAAHWQLRAGYSRGFLAPQAFNEDLHISLVEGQRQRVVLSEDLAPERSNSFTASVTYNGRLGGWRTRCAVHGFFTQLNQPFVNEALPNTGGPLQRLEKRNGTGWQRVYGGHLRAELIPTRRAQFSLGATWQRNRFAEPISWSDSPEAPTRRRAYRTPRLYGHLTLLTRPLPRTQALLTGTHTGPMLVPHFGGGGPGPDAPDVLTTSPHFLNLNLKLAHTFPLRASEASSLGLKVYGGVKNVLHSYQRDFDTGPRRDSNYIYGPTRPRTFFLGVDFGQLLDGG